MRPYSPEDLLHITPSNALHYYFNGPRPGQNGAHPLGADEAFDYLRSHECSLATQAWVQNHWALVLWKLAAYVCCRTDLFAAVWTFDEVCRHLMHRQVVPLVDNCTTQLNIGCTHRYKREIDRGQRPAVRLIQERDASPGRPVILCVSHIHWAEEIVEEDGTIIHSQPSLVLTDGWYNIRGRVDEPLIRAINRRLIRVGTKLAMSGIHVSRRRLGTIPLVS
jgi:breast cancer 2 susceptibility protein